MAQLAQAKLNLPVCFEISLTNVDKALPSFIDLQNRIALFEAEQTVVLDFAPRFIDKARLFNGAVFVVGVDTLVRIAALKYYQNQAEMQAVFAEFEQRNIRFLVFGRLLQGQFASGEQLDLPVELHKLCDFVSEADYRNDLSSTQLRQQA